MWKRHILGIRSNKLHLHRTGLSFSVKSKYKSQTSKKMILFSSDEGKELFAKALSANRLEMYFKLSEQVVTQSSQFACSLATAVVVLNTLAIDPGFTWKGIWRWFDDQSLLLDLKTDPFLTLFDISIVLLKHKCFVKVFLPMSPYNEDLSEDQMCIDYEGVLQKDEKILQEALSINLLDYKCSVDQQIQLEHSGGSLYTSNGVKNEHSRVNHPEGNKNDINPINHFFHRRACFASFETFEIILDTITRREGIYMLANYYRRCIEQTGTGHFSPIGGYYGDKVLILDVARFKYPFHWVDVKTLYHSFTHTDTQSRVSRGFILATK